MAAKDKDAKALPEGQGETVKKPSKFKRIVLLLAFLLILGAVGGAGAYWWFFIRTPAVDKHGCRGPGRQSSSQC